MTTAGASALQGNHAVKDAFIIQQLRASGAVLLGKTNLSEWANFVLRVPAADGAVAAAKQNALTF